MTSLLESIDSPDDLRMLTTSQLETVAREARNLIIQVVSNTGGHLASNLGVVELTLALHHCYDFRKDRLLWDVSHQAYTHKIITGRRDRFHTLRQKDGISGFTDPAESPSDLFKFGHTGTSISNGLGLACAVESRDQPGRTVAVIGDGAIASGMPFEALNHAAETDEDILVVLNDNKMSISPPVGGLAHYLSKIRSSDPYVGLKKEMRELVSRWSRAFDSIDKLYDRVSEGVQTALTPGGLFVELGLDYYGPVNGHDIKELVDRFQHMKRLNGPRLLHVVTEKGHGFEPASEDPTGYHSSGTFELNNGEIPCSQDSLEQEGEALEPESSDKRWSDLMGAELIGLAEQNPSICAITAAMCGGTGLDRFARLYPDRFYDVGICEQHAVGFAGGLSAGGLRPVACIYSTFLQRARDQIFHDIALQHAPVIFGIDRAGLVGNDGATHHGLHDVAMFRGLPDVVVMAPADAADLRRMLELALDADCPCAIRYPREDVPASDFNTDPDFALGEAGTVRSGNDGAFIGYGAMVPRAMEAAEILADDGMEITVINARFAKPLDHRTLRTVIEEHPAVIVAEDHVRPGGFGAAVLEEMTELGVDTRGLHLAHAPDRFVEHASREEQLAELKLNGAGLAERMRETLG